MNSHEFSHNQEQTRTQILRDLISGTEYRVDAEFQRTANMWPECFGSSIFAIETTAYGPVIEKELGVEKVEQMQSKLIALKKKLYDIMLGAQLA